MSNQNSRQKRTYEELLHRGDMATIDKLGLSMEIELDGIAWIELEACEACFHPGLGWCPTNSIGDLSHGYLTLLGAVESAKRFQVAHTVANRDNIRLMFDGIFGQVWPANPGPAKPRP